MRTFLSTIAIILGAAGVLAYLSFFIVSQNEQALVLEFGKPKRTVDKPGLQWKIPVVQTVVYYDKRILDLDTAPQEVTASDQKRIVVDAFTRYRITDPLRFYQALNNTRAANQTLERIVNDRVRSVLSGATTTQIINTNRAELMEKIQEEVNRETQALGITVVDVRLSRVELPRETTEAVFRRMKTDREREAADLRAQGTQLAQSIRSRADRDVQIILGEANRKADQQRGEGEAEKTRIMAEAYKRDPEFSSFYRSMLAYEESFRQGDTRMVLSPDSPFFRYFNQPSPGAQPKR